MTFRPKPLIAGNWKMNGLRSDLRQLTALGEGCPAAIRAKVDVLICPPATLLYVMAAGLLGSGIGFGAQDCALEPSGARTGDISAEMIADCGASHVIVGHSERRLGHGETSAIVRAKALAARRALLVPIICVGETLAEREAGRTLAVVRRQLRQSLPDGLAGHEVVIAYEPVWAIGTGRTPTLAEVSEVHEGLRGDLRRCLGRAAGDATRLLYGGSVNAANAAGLLALEHVDGALVGGASLTAADFLPIVRAAAEIDATA